MTECVAYVNMSRGMMPPHCTGHRIAARAMWCVAGIHTRSQCAEQGSCSLLVGHGTAVMRMLEAAQSQRRATLNVGFSMGQGYGSLHMPGNPFPTQNKPDLQGQGFLHLPDRMLSCSSQSWACRAGLPDNVQGDRFMFPGLTLPPCWRLELAARWLSSSSSSRRAACTSTMIWQHAGAKLCDNPACKCAHGSVLVHTCHSRTASLVCPGRGIMR